MRGPRQLLLGYVNLFVDALPTGPCVGIEHRFNTRGTWTMLSRSPHNRPLSPVTYRHSIFKVQNLVQITPDRTCLDFNGTIW